MSEELATRYGRTRSHVLRQRLLVVGAAVAIVGAAIAWVFWAGLGTGSDASLEATDTAHTILNSREVSVSFTINADQGSSVACAIEALDESFAIVGWKIVTYPHITQRFTGHTVLVRTTQLSNTGLISECWLT